MDGGQCILELEDVWKVYTMGEVEVPAIRGVSLCAYKGEYISIMGPSGSGKSTLLNLVGCLDTPTGGKILLGGLDISMLSENELSSVRRDTIGFVFQTFNLLPSLTAKENVALPMRFDGAPRGASLKKAEVLLELVGLAHRMNHKPSELSGGERQRVAIARALVNEPTVILADEPTGNLDTKSGARVVEMLEDLHKKGITLIVITHDQRLAERADRRFYLVDGKFVSFDEFNAKHNQSKFGESAHQGEAAKGHHTEAASGHRNEAASGHHAAPGSGHQDHKEKHGKEKK